MKVRTNIKILTSLAVFVLGSGFWASPSFGVNSAVDCNGANLNQALQGIGTDQFGVRNNNTEGKSFFVVCPNTHFATNANTVRLKAVFPPGGGDMTCVLRFQHFDNGGDFINVVVPIEATVANPGFIDQNFAEVSRNLRPNVTLVCPLDPGEGLNWFAVFLD